jgi:succinyl-diaminopimelate desuccinylase
MSAPPNPLDILQSLIRCPSVTPDEAGALSFLEDILRPAGFDCQRLRFGEVDNLFARFGTGRPHFCFAGHADVVPPGDDALWSHPPFAAEVADGFVYGRGASDMKGPLAAMTAAAIAFARNQKPEFSGSVSLLVTCDEEGPSVDGTAKVMGWLAENDLVPDHCVVGEPTSNDALGDAIKIGRRGSVHFTVTATGTQGHTAYPQFADNPVPKLARLIDRVATEPLDAGTEHFEPSTLAVTTFDVANPANNVIPASARARFNIRFNSLHDAASLHEWVKRHCDAVAGNWVAASRWLSRRMPTASSPSRGRWWTWSARRWSARRGESPSSPPRAAPRTPASSRTIARSSSSGRPTPPSTRPTSASRLPNSRG